MTGVKSTAQGFVRDGELEQVLKTAEHHAKEIQRIINLERRSKRPNSPASRRLNVLKQLHAAFDQLMPVYERIVEQEQHWKERVNRSFLELDKDLQDLCRGHGWRVDGQWPTFFIERGIPIEIDEDKRLAIVSRKKVEATAEAIGFALLPLVHQLMPKTFSADKFIVDLAAAYDEVKKAAAQVPILNVYKAMVVKLQAPRFWRDARSETFLPLTIDQFRARFSHVLEENKTTTPDARVLRTLPPLEVEDGIFIYQPAEARFGYIGRIEFVATNQVSST